MTIGYDAKRLFANRSGLGVYSRTLVRNLLEYGPHDWRFFLYTPRVDPGIDVADITSHPRVTLRHHEGPLGAVWRTRGIIRDLKRDDIDLYHGLSHELPVGIERTGIRSVVTMHDLIYQHYPEQFGWFDRRMYDWKFGGAMRRADHVIAISEQTRADLLARYPEVPASKVSVVYQSCAREFFEASAKTEDADVLQRYRLTRGDYVLYVGSFVARKRPELVPEIVAGLSAKQAPREVIFVGRGPEAYRRRVLAKAESLGLRARILTEINETRELAAVYRGAAALVYPSVYEGFGIPVAEGLLSGIPVVTTRTGALEEAGGPHAFYGGADDKEELSGALERALEELSMRASEEGRAYAKQKFSRAATAMELTRVYAYVTTL